MNDAELAAAATRAGAADEMYAALDAIANQLARIVNNPAALADWASLDELRMTAQAALAVARGEQP